MSDKDIPSDTTNSVEALKLFNEFQSQSRARAEATLKLVLVISGGMLTLSVGAILGSSPPSISPHLLPALKWGWIFLFCSIVASLLLMASMIIATFHMGVRWQKALEDKKKDLTFVATWPWLRVLNGVLGASILFSCIGGIALMAYVALGVIDVSNVVQRASTQKNTAVQTPSKKITAPNNTVVRDARKNSARPLP